MFNQILKCPKCSFDKPIFKDNFFDLVICQGVLHHTSDPYLGFQSISKLVKKDGYIIIGLYNKYGRLINDIRKAIFKITKNRFKYLDPRLRTNDRGKLKRAAWFNDQYKHPHESKHIISEVLKWFKLNDFDFVNSIPKTKLFNLIKRDELLFKFNDKSDFIDHFISQIAMLINGYKEGGLFLMIGKKK